MKILVACEESQAVTKEFRFLGHEAYSCDIIECSGGHPEWHIKYDCTQLLNGKCFFYTCDGSVHFLESNWDMIIAFPPFTYLTVTGNRWFNINKYGTSALDRIAKRQDAIRFFLTIANSDCKKIAIENPVGVMSSYFRKPDQIINPYLFGDPFEKRTCLWLKGLPNLIPTNIVDVPQRVIYDSGCSMPKWYVDAWYLPKNERAKFRSRTFPGIAKAIASQWNFV